MDVAIGNGEPLMALGRRFCWQLPLAVNGYGNKIAVMGSFNAKLCSRSVCFPPLISIYLL